jgi:glycosyltransferase involved in cell wall biosynthesis
MHLQHEESILGQDARLPRLLRGAHDLGIATAVTLHSVYGGALGVPGIRYSGRRFQQAIGEHADRIIVHQIDGCQDRLLEQGIARDKVIVIPHGTNIMQLEDRGAARAELGIDEEIRLILAIGFIHKKKGLHTLVEALPAVQRKIARVQLLVAGSFRTRPWDRLYNKRLRRSMEPGLRDGSIELREGFQSSESMHTMLSAADVLALPYRQAYGSASGVLHLALGAGAPVLCADGYKFAEAKRAWGHEHPTLFPAPEDAGAWATALCEVLGKPELLEELAGRSKVLGEDTTWQRVAEQHIAGFKEALASCSAAAA